MRMRWRTYTVVALLCLLPALGFAEGEALEQPDSDIELFVNGGLSLPQGTSGSTGPLVNVGLAIPLIDPSVALQFESTWSQVSFDDDGHKDMWMVGLGPRLRGDLFGLGILLPHAEFIVNWLQVGGSNSMAVKYGGGLEFTLTDAVALDMSAHGVRSVTNGDYDGIDVLAGFRFKLGGG